MTAQMTPQEFNRIRIAFMQRLSAPSVPAVAFKLGWLIAYKYMNRETRVAYPPHPRLAADLGCSISTIKRLIDILERHGLHVAPGVGRGKASVYWIDPEKGSPMNPFPPRKRVHPTPIKGFTGEPPTKEGNQEVKKPRAARASKKARARLPQNQNLEADISATRSPFPEGWQPADLTPDQHADFDHFADHARTCARTCADWDAAWRNWQRKSVRMQQQERPNGRSLLAAFDRAIDRDAAAAYVPGSEGPQPITLDSRPRPAGIRSLPKG